MHNFVYTFLIFILAICVSVVFCVYGMLRCECNYIMIMNTFNLSPFEAFVLLFFFIVWIDMRELDKKNSTDTLLLESKKM